MNTTEKSPSKSPESTTRPPGVLVIGGGISGVQAALSIANAGYKAYLVEKLPAMGGRLAFSDKEYPVDECPICVLGPKMLLAGRHPNIELFTCAEVTGLEGSAGDFTASIRMQPRFVQPDKCEGCGECFDVCPVAITEEIGQLRKTHKAIYRLYPQAVPSTVAIAKRGTPPCTAGCPIHQNAQGYVALIAQGRFDEALEVILRENPLPSICGRICTHPCMTQCTRKGVDDSINIPALKRFVTDNSDNWRFPIGRTTRRERVAIIGSGPAGLMCAFLLRTMGYKPTIFEALDRPGGMLMVGIPSFRLPRKSILDDIHRLEAAGVEIVLNTSLGKDISLKELRESYEAIFLGIGAHTERKLNIPGEDAIGVWGGVEFLREVNTVSPVKLGKKVLVIGGGNSALDAARTALRCGAKEVQIIYRRTRVEMPADSREISEAEDEGVRITFLAAPVEIEINGAGEVKALKCIKMKLGAPDASGRARPKPVPESEFLITCDNVIVTIGQAPHLEALGETLGLETTKWDTFNVDPLTGQTNIPDIFAGGDCVTGPDVVVNAMYAGRKAAISIDRFLRAEDLHENREDEGPYRSEYTVDTAGVLMKRQISVPSIDIPTRRTTFKEVHTGYTPEQAIEEASRCLQCGICCDCRMCVETCTRHAIDHSMRPREETIKIAAVINAVSFHEFDPKKGPVPSEAAAELAKVLDIDAHDRRLEPVKRPHVDVFESSRQGVLLCGGWVEPDIMHEVLERASQAAHLALRYLTKDAKLGNDLPLPFKLPQSGVSGNGRSADAGSWEHTMQVNADLCRACSTCVNICPYHAPSIKENNGRMSAAIDTVKCKACGTCTTWCPTGAIHAIHYVSDPVEARVQAIMDEL